MRLFGKPKNRYFLVYGCDTAGRQYSFQVVNPTYPSLAALQKIAGDREFFVVAIQELSEKDYTDYTHGSVGGG